MRDNIDYEAFAAAGIDPSLAEELIDEWTEDDSTPESIYDDSDNFRSAVPAQGRLVGGYNPTAAMLENCRKI